MTSQAILGESIKVTNPKSSISKNSKVDNQKHETFSQVMNKDKADNNRVNNMRKNNLTKSQKVDYREMSGHINNSKSQLKVNGNKGKANTPFVKEQFIKDVKEVINDIAKAYTEALDISEDELIDIMETLGVNMFQLPMEYIVKDIVLAVNGENDITGLLVNENALNGLNKIKEFFDQYNVGKHLQMQVDEFDGLVKEAVDRLTQLVNEQMNVSEETVEIVDTIDIMPTDLENVIDTEAKAGIVPSDTEDVNIISDTVNISENKSVDVEIIYDKEPNILSDNVTNNTANVNLTPILDEVSESLVSDSLDNTSLDSQDITMVNDASKNIDEDSVMNVENMDVKETFISNQNNAEVILNNQDVTADVETVYVNAEDDVLNINTDISVDDNTDNINNDNQSELQINSLENKSTTGNNDTSFESNADSEMSENITRNDNKEQVSKEHTSEAFFDKFISNLEKSLGVKEGDLISEMSHVREMREVVEQIVDRLKVHINKDSTTMTINLTPDELGKVELSVTSKNGVMTAQFIVESKTAKDAIENGLPALIEKFEHQGLKVEAVEVTIADYNMSKDNGKHKGSEEYDYHDKKRKKSGKISLEAIDDIAEEEVQITRSRSENTTTIDYVV